MHKISTQIINKKTAKRICIGLLAFGVLAGFSLSAQDFDFAPQQQQAPELSDGELENFVNAYLEVQSVQMEMSAEIQDIIADSDLSEQEFEEIHQAANSMESQDMDGISAAKQQEFTQVLQGIQVLQQESQAEMISVISQYGMDVESFNAISMGIQQDPDLYQRFVTIAEAMQN